MKFRRRRLIDRRTWKVPKLEWLRLELCEPPFGMKLSGSEKRSGGGLGFVVGAAEEIEHTVDDFFFRIERI